MSYFDSEKNVDDYLKMIEGYDGAALLERFKSYAPAKASVLELGMGGGGDLDLLRAAGFEATGSDASEVFLKRYKARGGSAPTLQLDACSLETELRFDALFSNKVLHHLSSDDLQRSLKRQAQILNPEGLAFHSMWAGTGHEEHHGMRFHYYTRESFEACLPGELELIGFGLYEEMGPEDSFWAAIQKRS